METTAPFCQDDSTRNRDMMTKAVRSPSGPGAVSDISFRGSWCNRGTNPSTVWQATAGHCRHVGPFRPASSAHCGATAGAQGTEAHRCAHFPCYSAHYNSGRQEFEGITNMPAPSKLPRHHHISRSVFFFSSSPFLPFLPCLGDRHPSQATIYTENRLQLSLLHKLARWKVTYHPSHPNHSCTGYDPPTVAAVPIISMDVRSMHACMDRSVLVHFCQLYRRWP